MTRAIFMWCAATALLHSLVRALPKLVLDTDLGTDFDDAWALTYLLSRSQPSDANRLFDFVLCQVSTFNTTKRALIAARMMHDVGRYDVPIAVGDYTGEDSVPQFGAVGNYSLEQFVADGGTVLRGTAQLALLMRAATAEDPLFIAEIAPATSLGGVIASDPTIAANVIVVAMSGSIRHGYGNSSSPSAEYNVYQNVTASQHMYAAQWLSPLMTAPLDTSGLLRCTVPEYTGLLASSSSYAKMVLRNFGVWCNCDPKTQVYTDILYDAQAAYQVRAPLSAAARFNAQQLVIASLRFSVALQLSFYATQWSPGGPSGPPRTPGLTFEVLRLSVNASSFTVPDPAGQLVWTTTSFPEGLESDAHVVCGGLIAWITTQQ